ncbi:hypothetical protein ACWD6U_00455 [Streptomyces sp. NPDC005149]
MSLTAPPAPRITYGAVPGSPYVARLLGGTDAPPEQAEIAGPAATNYAYVKGPSAMPRPNPRIWNCRQDDCAACTSSIRDDMTLLRCSLLFLLEQGRWMASDDIPLPEVLSAGGDYLDRMAHPHGDGTVPVPPAEQWAWIEAELRLAVARAAGLDATSALDPRIKPVLAKAARRSWRHHVDLLDRAAEQLIEHLPPRTRTT